MMTAGMPSMAASSSSAIDRPVLPDPVIPTMTPCVVRLRASYMMFLSGKEAVGGGAVFAPGEKHAGWSRLSDAAGCSDIGAALLVRGGWTYSIVLQCSVFSV